MRIVKVSELRTRLDLAQAWKDVGPAVKLLGHGAHMLSKRMNV